MAIAPRAKISIGTFKHMAELQRLMPTKDETDESGFPTDESGFHKENWVTFAKLRCNVEFDDRLMREIFKDDGIDTVSVKIFTFRYFEGLSIKDRILYKGQSYEIYGFNNLNEENRFYKVWARSVE